MYKRGKWLIAKDICDGALTPGQWYKILDASTQIEIKNDRGELHLFTKNQTEKYFNIAYNIGERVIFKVPLKNIYMTYIVSDDKLVFDDDTDEDDCIDIFEMLGISDTLKCLWASKCYGYTCITNKDFPSYKLSDMKAANAFIQSIKKVCAAYNAGTSPKLVIETIIKKIQKDGNSKRNTETERPTINVRIRDEGRGHCIKSRGDKIAVRVRPIVYSEGINTFKETKKDYNTEEPL